MKFNVFIFTFKALYLVVINGGVCAWAYLSFNMPVSMPDGQVVDRTIPFIVLGLLALTAVVINWIVGKNMYYTVKFWAEVRRRERDMIVVGSGAMVENTMNRIRTYTHQEILSDNVLWTIWNRKTA